MNPWEKPYKELVLEPTKFGLMHGVSAEFLSDPNGMDFIQDRMTVQLKAMVLGERLEDFHAQSKEQIAWLFPASPWQHFKEKHKWSWWLRRFVSRFPVQKETHFRTVECNIQAQVRGFYPHQTLADPRLGTRVVLPTNIDMTWEPE